MKQTNFLNGKIKIFGFLMILAILIGNVNVTAIPKVSVCGCQGANYLFNCSNTVNESCTLNCNLNSSGTCFTIGADNIVIDGKGFLINGSGSGTGISSSGFSNITIKNCDIRWFQTGIYFENSEDNLILNNTLMYNGIISIDNTGIHFNHVNDSSIIGNTVSSNDFGINLDYSSDNNITNNTVNNNGKGIHIFASSGNTVDNNNVSSNNCSGIYVEGDGLC